MKPVALCSTGTDAERYEVRVGQAEPHTVRIEQRGGRQPTFLGFVDGWPVTGIPLDTRAGDGRIAVGAIAEPAPGAAKDADKAKGLHKVKALFTLKEPQKVTEPENLFRRATRYFFAFLLAVLLLLSAAIFVRNQVNDASLAAHGKVITAQIVGTDHETDDNGANDYIDVWIPACNCPVQLATDNPDAHPKGSTIGVLYDTTDPTNARPLVDGNSTWTGWVIDVFCLVAAWVGIVCVYALLNPEIDRLRLRRRTAKRTRSAAAIRTG